MKCRKCGEKVERIFPKTLWKFNFFHFYIEIVKYEFPNFCKKCRWEILEKESKKLRDNQGDPTIC